MKFLLDTHTFVWLHLDQKQLSTQVRAIIASPANTVLFSYAIWELQIKIQLHKLHLTTSLADAIKMQQQNNHVSLLPIDMHHIFRLESLPLLHRDPFDRLIIAQSIAEGLPILSKDSAFAQYPTVVIW
jgi:PIN domain nuclease of toxin-antitoxin system